MVSALFFLNPQILWHPKPWLVCIQLFKRSCACVQYAAQLPVCAASDICKKWKDSSWKLNCPVLRLLSWNWGLRPREAPGGLQLQVPVLPEALWEAGAADRWDPQNWADVRWHLCMAWRTCVPLPFLCAGLAESMCNCRARHPWIAHMFNLAGSVTWKWKYTLWHCGGRT